MKALAIALIMGMSLTANAADKCSKYCNPERSKPCGNACIALQNNCTKDWTTACSGTKPSNKSENKTPKHVDVAP